MKITMKKKIEINLGFIKGIPQKKRQAQQPVEIEIKSPNEDVKEGGE